MRIPTSGPHKRLRMVVRKRSSAHDVTRPNVDTSGRFNESAETLTTIEGVDAWLHQPNEVNIDDDFGDRLGGDLQGLAMPAADVAVGDRYDHGLETYEVQQIRHLPDEGDQQIKLFSLERRTND